MHILITSETVRKQKLTELISLHKPEKVGMLMDLKGQCHGRYHDFWPKFTKFKL